MRASAAPGHEQVIDISDVATAAWGYGYDELGRLESVTQDSVAFASYVYDANGNLLSRTSGSGVESGTRWRWWCSTRSPRSFRAPRSRLLVAWFWAGVLAAFVVTQVGDSDVVEIWVGKAVGSFVAAAFAPIMLPLDGMDFEGRWWPHFAGWFGAALVAVVLASFRRRDVN